MNYDGKRIELCRFGHVILDDHYCLLGHVRPMPVPEDHEAESQEAYREYCKDEPQP